jgi:hypothetical protein
VNVKYYLLSVSAQLCGPEAGLGMGAPLRFSFGLYGKKDPWPTVPVSDDTCLSIAEPSLSPGVEHLVLPGELEYERRETRRREGIPVHADAPNVLRTFCETLGLDSPLAR